MVLASAPASARDLGKALPPIVFVSRTPPAGRQAGQVPGLGPHGTFVTGHGVLMQLLPGHAATVLVGSDRVLDVADPAASPDGAAVAFAAVAKPGDHWRIWVVARAGGEPKCVTCGPPGVDPPADDADPCWWGDTLVFASTRAGGRALYDGSPVTQLWLKPPAGQMVQLTHDANGAIDPCVDAAAHRLVFARWWFNPWVSDAQQGLTRDHAHALTPDSVNVWQVVSASLVRDARGAPALGRTAQSTA